MKPHFAAAALIASAAPLTMAAPAMAQSSPSSSPVPSTAAPSISVPVPEQVFSGRRSRDVLTAQVLLDRSRHSPGVIDGISGGNTARAIRTFQRAAGIAVDGRVSADLLRRLAEGDDGAILQRHRLTAEEVSGPFVAVPGGMAEMAELERVGYESPAEKIAELFHMDIGFLEALNPGADFGSAGTEILVIVPRTDGLQSPVARIEVDKSANSVRAYGEDGALVATYPATIGSSTFPSPSGAMTVRAVAPDATYHFDPEGREWGPDERLTIAAGPNNPVGGIWIDLSRDGYGIHGSPDPKLIGKTASHGCVRLTNWDAEELAQAVSPGTEVVFV